MLKAMHVFYKDLHLHQGLMDLGKTHEILPYFLWSEHLNQDVDDTPSLQYRQAGAHVLNNKLLPQGVNLLLGESVDDILSVCRLYGISHIQMLKHYEPRERAFQENLKEGAQAYGISLTLLETYVLVPLSRVLKTDGKPYHKFTPFYKRWLSQLSIQSGEAGPIRWIKQPIGPTFDFEAGQVWIKEDYKQLNAFMMGAYKAYDVERDFPANRGTSALSALVNHGLVSVHEIYGFICHHPDRHMFEGYLRQLAWRDFMISVMWHHPQCVEENYNQKIHIAWLNNALDFATWCRGQTGFPLVDAAMKELYHTGRMHNRLRMVVASFLVKDLLIDWWEGANWFKEHLIDYDLALNVGGWQWCASTGVDAVPYFRIFNPTSQAVKYDPAGYYIQSQICELAGWKGENIHNPLDNGIPYYGKCVDHSVARKRFLAHITKT